MSGSKDDAIDAHDDADMNEARQTLAALLRRIVTLDPENTTGRSAIADEIRGVIDGLAERVGESVAKIGRWAADALEECQPDADEDINLALDSFMRLAFVDVPDVLIIDDETDAATTEEGASEAPVSDHPVEDVEDMPSESSVETRGEDAMDAPAEEAGPPRVVDVSVLASDPELASDFLGESMEHFDDVDVQLLKIDGGEEDEEALNAVFRAFHTIKGTAAFLDLMPVHDLAHEAETLLDLARDGEMTLQGTPLELIFEANEVMKGLIASIREALGDGQPFPVEESFEPLIRSLRAAAAGEDVPEASTPVSTPAEVAPLEVAPAAPSPEVASESEPPTAPDAPTPDAADAPQAAPTPTAPEPTADPEPAAKATGGTQAIRESIRVDAERLDNLMDGIGELVIAEAMLSEALGPQRTASIRLSSILNQMDKITRELHEMAMSLRMMPVRPTFQKMARLARDVAKKVDKRVDFEFEGGDTELDKTVVDVIGDPLVHMVRNAIDHGLEPDAQARIDAGKNPVGKVTLRAFHQGGSIYLEIEDDGRGLDREAILDKARRNGLVTDGSSLSDGEVFNLIFEPGFSTAAAVTELSGRGVGLDVVKRSIEQLRGRIDIRSTPGEGSVFCIRLPLTLAIIEGMVVSVGDQRFIFPTLSIVRMLHPQDASVKTVFGRGEMLMVEDELIPLHDLADFLEVAPEVEEGAAPRAAVIVEEGGRQHAFIVDELVGQQQIVIKSLGGLLAGTSGLAGGAIMPDGRVGLILDIGALMRLVNEAHHPEGRLVGAR